MGIVKNNLICLVFLLMPLTVLCAENAITGKWYGQRIENDKLLHWLIDRKEDGTYKLYFKECHSGILSGSQIEAGDWTYNNGMYRTVTKLLIDSEGPYQPDTPDKVYIEEYEAISLTDEIFIYRHIEKQKQYKVFKMPDNFELACVSAI